MDGEVTPPLSASARRGVPTRSANSSRQDVLLARRNTYTPMRAGSGSGSNGVCGADDAALSAADLPPQAQGQAQRNLNAARNGGAPVKRHQTDSLNWTVRSPRSARTVREVSAHADACAHEDLGGQYEFSSLPFSAISLPGKARAAPKRDTVVAARSQSNVAGSNAANTNGGAFGMFSSRAISGVGTEQPTSSRLMPRRNNSFKEISGDDLDRDDSPSGLFVKEGSRVFRQGSRLSSGPISGSSRRASSFSLIAEKIPVFGFMQESEIVSRELFDRIVQECPPRVRAADVSLVYSFRSHKRAIRTFYRAVAKRRFLLLLVKDNYGYSFGMFSSQLWKPQPSYYGTDDCFFFRAEPELCIYHSTGDNSLYQLANAQYIASGGGGKNRDFGLYLDADFQFGRSCACDTYQNLNEGLSKHKDFDIVMFEVWAFKVSG
ncbi:Oxidation resistance protein 1 [Porphyridium purpureum]|uniref:Oxidation resistance protein 1 n=1 Tax=Porphyridium purpureum TaxID=35688 RepID=A0A5J4Z963_PORPP|nr:Oxidation resistance protein 1 [Porphyridium purpureum]|eukprot:POR2574..scf295_1